MSNYLKENETLRSEIKRDVLNNIQGRQGIPRLRWFMERADGSFEGTDGKIVAAEAIAAKAGISVFIEEY